MSLLFYDDSPVFGGHEVMSLLGLEAVLNATSEPLVFMVSEANVKLCESVGALCEIHPHLRLEKLAWHSSKLEALRNRLIPSRSARLAAWFGEFAPARIIAIQGNIEHSSLALHAACKAGIPSVSYIPVPHSNAAMGARFGTIRDRFCNSLFKLPDHFITITDEMARLLRMQGATSPIDIVYNGVDTRRFQSGDSCPACQEFGLPLTKVRIGVVGRIEFRQKQQDLLARAVAGDSELSSRCHLVFAGEGPDAERLGKMISDLQLSATILPWCDPARLYHALDALVIPSRYEGLPLVMLEALASGTTVIGSDRDGMKDLLPASRRFQPDNADALASVIHAFIRDRCAAPHPGLISRVRTTMSLDAFNHAFASVILRLSGNARN